MAESSEEIVPRRKPRILRVLILLVLILIGIGIVFRLNLSRKLQHRLDAIRADGYPVTGVELNNWYSIPDGAANAADTLLLAFSYYHKWKGSFEKQLPIIGQADLPPRTEPLDEKMRQLIADYLEDNQKAMELLHEGAAIEHSRYPIDFSMGMNMLVPHLSDIRTAARLLQLEAILNAENADASLAVRSIVSGFGVAHSLTKEPLTASQLVRIACQASMLLGLERVLNRTRFTDSQLAELAAAVKNAQDLEAMSRAFVGERCTAIEFFKYLDSDAFALISSGDMPPAAVIWLYRAVGFADRDALTYLDFLDEYLKAGVLSLPERIKVAGVITQRIEDVPKSRILLRLLAPAWGGQITFLEARNIAQLRTAEMAIAVLRYRLATGTVPETLSELVPAYISIVAKDPFDGRDLRYRKTDAGFIVYSIGKDRYDDGGIEQPPRGKRRNKSLRYDITFTFGR